ncbi:hypothetical protein ERC79_17515 [Rhodococcus sp. ABRD24]|uniref:cell division protein PerM n=1 Tax=Rhodococcus sp. ABRD24 TaxID=2507582 RepID=UPI00103EB9ED|nr:DUF6350 family protein [Rhodococcus sp. ABRD24]QBJ97539.1 hypothetical protein ERC79_17515 [Rhodococcus sp. ABRD24]
MSSLLSRGARGDTSSRSGPTRDQTRELLTVAVRPAAMAVVLFSAVVIVTLVASNSDLTGTFGAIAASWLALHQVSLTITGAPLAILPLLPTAILMWAVGRGCARAVTPRTSLPEALRVVGAAVAGPLVMTLIALAVVSDAATVIALSPPSAPEASGWTIGIHLVAASAGIAAVIGRAECERLGLPDWLPMAVRSAVRASGLLLAAGGLATVASLVLSWSEVGALIDEGGGVMGMLGLTVLSVLYLPNVAVGAAAVLTGGTVHVGGSSLSLFDILPGAVPPMPVLGGIPTELAGSGWPILLAVPVIVGALLGRDCGRLRLPPVETSYAVLIAAASVGVAAAAVGYAGGGEVGAFGFVGVEWWAFGLVTFGWLALPGVAVALLLTLRGGVRSDSADVGEASAEEVADSGAITPIEVVDAVAAPVLRYRSGDESGEATALPEGEVAGESPTADGTVEATEATEVVENDTEGREGKEGKEGTEHEADTIVDAEVVAVIEEDLTPVAEAADGAEAPEAREGDLPDSPVTPRD